MLSNRMTDQEKEHYSTQQEQGSERATFVRWACGCVGLRVPRSGDIVILDCRAEDDDDMTFNLKPEGIDKDAVPLMPGDIKEVCDAVKRRINEGGAYRDLSRDIKCLLRTLKTTGVRG